MRVLVTRPEPSAARTAERLERRGHDPIVLPLLQALPDLDGARKAIGLPHAAIALTSAEAVRTLEQLGQDLAPHLSTSLYCVGGATAQAAAGLGFTSIITGPGDGAGLAQVVLKADLAKTGLLYLAGHPRAPVFENRLQAAGLPFTTAEIYRMVPVAHPHGHLHSVLAETKPQAILFYSRETALSFFDRLGPGLDRLAGIRILCLSQTIADALPQGLSHVSIAENSDEDSLFRLL